MVKIVHTVVGILHWTDQQPAADFYIATSLVCYLWWLLWCFSCRHMPGHASREVLIVLGSLSTCDPGDIGETIKVCMLYFNTLT